MALLFLGLFIPVILLYLLKQRRRRVEVSTLLFWDKILRDEQTVTSLTRLKKLLSLLLQLAFIALLAFAVARPMLSGKWTGARRMVLLLDTSASMLVNEGGKTRFELAREKAHSVIRGMGIGDSLMIVSVSATPDIAAVFSDNRKDLSEALDKIEITHGEGDFAKALQLVEQLPADERETEVYLVTDGAFAPVNIRPLAKTRFAYVKIGEATGNIGITSFQVRPMPSSPRDFQIHLEIANETEQDQRFPVELRINGSLVDAFEFTVSAGQSLTRDLKQYSAQGGEVEVFADFKDPFPLDNRAYGVLPPPRLIKVALVSETDLFLERALATDDGVELFAMKPEAYPGTNQVDVTVFAGWHPPHVPRGHSIFILNWPDDAGLVRKGTVEKPLFTEWDRAHPINRHLALQNVSIEKAVAVQASHQFIPLARSFNDPLVLLKEDADKKLMFVAFDPNSSDLPLRIAFPIMIANAVRYLGGADSTERWGNPPIGSILSSAEVRKLNHGKDSFASVEGPVAQRFDLTSESSLVPVTRVGFYRAEVASTNVPLFAANLDSKAESRIKPSEQLPLKASEPIAQIKNEHRLGFEPWFALVALALLLSTVEWGLFHRRVIE
jgi:hypothetical protein